MRDLLSTDQLTLAADAAIDLQLHTTYSDGVWTPEGLLNHLAEARFGLAAITDHDRPDTAAELQQLARAAHMPLLVAVEMTTIWRDQMVDVLCFGYRLDQPALYEVARDVAQRQSENTFAVYAHLRRSGKIDEVPPAALAALLATPSAQQPHALVDLVAQHAGLDRRAAGMLVEQAGVTFATTPIATVVEAAHASGALCLIAHPGRSDGFACFDAALLDQLRQTVSIDGLEVYYPAHTVQQTALYREYAQHWNLLVSAGSDSHGPHKPPIAYRADQCRALLERLGVRVR